VGIAVLGTDEVTHDSLYSTGFSYFRVVQLRLQLKTDRDMRIRILKYGAVWNVYLFEIFITYTDMFIGVLLVQM